MTGLSRSRWMLALILTALETSSILSCAGRKNSAASSSVGGAGMPGMIGQTIYVAREIPYADPSTIQKSILEQCVELQERQAEFIASYARDKGINVVRDDGAVKAGKGKVLDVKILDAVSSGNPFIGHHKLVTVRGRLLDNGTEIANFTARRTSRGGFGGGFKGSCTVLDRCVDTLGGDIAEWLKAPTRNAHLGDD
jgi:hypothetical protein